MKKKKEKPNVEYISDERFVEEVKEEKPIPKDVWKRLFGDRPYPEGGYLSNAKD